MENGYRWKCKTCSRVTSIRNDSFFSGSHLSLQQILLIIYGWAKDIVIGGLNDDMTSKVVEIDESKFFHRKYHRGQWRHWVFGGIERNTRKCFLVEVPDRTAETLSNLIQRYCYDLNFAVN
jgi:hypothetical protein